MARGKFTQGQCGRSGIVMPRLEMIHDGLYPNMLVHPDWYEPPYPLQDPSEVDYTDRPLEVRPAPRTESIDVTVRFPLFDVATGEEGPDLFRLCSNELDLIGGDFRVALYNADPGAVYATDGEITASGYTPGGMPIDQSLSDGILSIANTAWEGSTISAAWILVYEAQTGQCLFRGNLGSLHASVNGTFTIDWSNICLVANDSGTAIKQVVTPKQPYQPSPEYVFPDGDIEDDGTTFSVQTYPVDPFGYVADNPGTRDNGDFCIWTDAVPGNDLEGYTVPSPGTLNKPQIQDNMEALRSEYIGFGVFSDGEIVGVDLLRDGLMYRYTGEFVADFLFNSSDADGNEVVTSDIHEIFANDFQFAIASVAHFVVLNASPDAPYEPGQKIFLFGATTNGTSADPAKTCMVNVPAYIIQPT